MPQTKCVFLSRLDLQSSKEIRRTRKTFDVTLSHLLKEMPYFRIFSVLQ